MDTQSEKSIFELMAKNAIECAKNEKPLTESERASIEKQREEYARQEKRKAWETKKKYAGIPKRYAACSFEGIERKGVPADCQKLYGIMKNYAEHLEENYEDGRGILFVGNVGRMKTTFAIAIGQEALKAGKSVYFIPMAELLTRLLKESRQRGADDGIAQMDLETKITKIDFLILDDLGAEYHNDWVLNSVDAIITRRFNDMKPTIITTNLSMDEMKGRYAGRVIDRLKSAYLTLVTDGESKRPQEEFIRI